MRGAQKVAPWTASYRSQTQLCLNMVHGAIFNLKRKGFRFPTLRASPKRKGFTPHSACFAARFARGICFPTRLSAICKAVDRVTLFTSSILSASPLSLTPLREATRAATLVAALAVRGGALSQRAVALTSPSHGSGRTPRCQWPAWWPGWSRCRPSPAPTRSARSSPSW